MRKARSKKNSNSASSNGSALNRLVSTRLKVGDAVMVISGGNRLKRANKGQVGKIVKFVGDERDRVVVEGVNVGIKHKRAVSTVESGGKISKHFPIHISNVMYYSDKYSRPFKLSVQTLNDGSKVRGYKVKVDGNFQFEQI